jgi:hypothetical protein
MVTPAGELTYIPQGPKVMNVPKHSIVFPDTISMLTSEIGRGQLSSLHSKSDNSDVVAMLNKLNNTIKNKTENHWHNKRNSGWEQIKRGGGNETRYLT